jgi:thiol:disulfide interchange protein
VTILVFMVLGLGLSMPYLVLSFAPQLRKYLPRPGAWMDTFKKILSVPMFASAMFLAWVYGQQSGPLYGMFMLISLILMMFSITLLKSPERRVKLFAAFFLLNAMWPILISTEPPAAVAEDPRGWVSYSAEYLATIEKGNDPILVNMTAAWCITCKVNEQTTLSTDRAKELFVMYDVRLVKGDWTSYNPEITGFLNKFGRDGVPLYVYYPSPVAPGQGRPAPVILPSILTPSILESTIAGGQ